MFYKYAAPKALAVVRSGDSAERRILLFHFSDGGFLPKAATTREGNALQHSRAVPFWKLVEKITVNASDPDVLFGDLCRRDGR